MRLAMLCGNRTKSISNDWRMTIRNFLVCTPHHFIIKKTVGINHMRNNMYNVSLGVTSCQPPGRPNVRWGEWGHNTEKIWDNKF